MGLPGAAANVALCAVNQGCLANVSKLDKAGLNLMQAIETIMNWNDSKPNILTYLMIING